MISNIVLFNNKMKHIILVLINIYSNRVWIAHTAQSIKRITQGQPVQCAFKNKNITIKIEKIALNASQYYLFY
jgi:hypothetical protein